MEFDPARSKKATASSTRTTTTATEKPWSASQTIKPMSSVWVYLPSKNELARSCKNLARILLAWHVHAICPFSCAILAQSCTYLARNGAGFCCKNNYLHFLHIFCKILQELVQDCARKWTYHVHVPSKSCMQDSCKILAQSCKFTFAGWPRTRGPCLAIGKPV